MQVQIEQALSAGTSALVDLPIENWDQIEDFWIKWDVLFYRIRGEEAFRELPLDSETMDLVDWKRPIGVTVFEVDEDGMQTGEILGEQG